MKRHLLIFAITAACFSANAQTNASSAMRAAEIKEKDALIAQFTPIVSQPGDVAHGQQLFAQYCGTCHLFAGVGKAFGPDLSEMGHFGPEKLLVHVLDPNRNIDPDYYTTRVDTQDGEEYDGVVLRDNSRGITLHAMAGDMFINAADVKSRTPTGRSLMPDGFEAIGGEGLRDVLAFICAGKENFRMIDLHTACTADSRKGLWTDPSNADESLNFRKFGVVKAGDVPFYVMHPLAWGAGKNIIMLKGQNGLAKDYPKSVEVPDVNIKAVKLDFLGGIASGESQPGNPIAKVTVHYADNSTEEIILKYGEDFLAWNAQSASSNLNDASNLLRHGQLHWSSKPLMHSGIIRSLTLESMDNGIAPAFVAITVETGTA